MDWGSSHLVSLHNDGGARTASHWPGATVWSLFRAPMTYLGCKISHFTPEVRHSLPTVCWGEVQPVPPCQTCGVNISTSSVTFQVFESLLGSPIRVQYHYAITGYVAP